MNFQEIFINSSLFALFLICIFGYVVNVQNDNNAPNQIADNVLFNNTFSHLKSNVSSTENTSNTQGNLFYGEKPTPGFGSIVLFTIVAIGKTFSNILFGTLLIIFQLPLIVLGIDPTITSTIWSILVLTTVIGVWLLYKLGG